MGRGGVFQVSRLRFQKLPSCVGCSLLTFAIVAGLSRRAEGLDVFAVMCTPLHTTFRPDDDRLSCLSFRPKEEFVDSQQSVDCKSDVIFEDSRD